MRYGIRELLLVLAGTAVLCALFLYARNFCYADRRQAEKALADVKGISDVQLHSHTDIVEEVHSCSFKVDGNPESKIVIGGLSHYQSARRFSVSRIGKWTFIVSGRRHLGAYVAATAEPVESDYFGVSLSLGPDSPYKELFPFHVNTLQDVADHYQDLVNLFESWPREAEPGEVTLDDGTKQFFYVVADVE